MSKVKALYHIVFCTKCRQMSISSDFSEDLYRFIYHDIQDMGCRLIRIGGIQNHIHMLIDIHPTMSLASLMQKIKGNSSGWMQKCGKFPKFTGWAKEYYACTISPNPQNIVVEYIKNQKSHHKTNEFSFELSSLYQYADIQFDDRDMM